MFLIGSVDALNHTDPRSGWLVADDAGDSPKRWRQREQVQALRQQGLSYREILAQVPFSLSRSTISHWCKEIELTSEQLDRLDRLYREGSYRGRLLGPKATQRRRAEEVTAIRTAARAEASDLIKHPLWIAGLMLYWAEGAKTHQVSVSNSDPALMKFMMRWLRETCQIPEGRFRVQLHLHSGQDAGAIRSFWSDVLHIPLEQFIKIYIKREGSGHRKRILYHGTARVYVSDGNLLHRILGWIDGFNHLHGWAVSSTGRAAPS